MAEFNSIVHRIFDLEGGYQANPADSGNWLCKNLKWVKGKAGAYRCDDGSSPTLVGTNRGIAAPTYANHIGKFITAADSKAITEAQAFTILKTQYWDRIKGDYINSQPVANLLLDGVVNMGVGTAVEILQKTLNGLGASLTPDGIVGTLTLAAINAANPATLHNAYREARESYYRSVAANDSGKAEFLPGWLARLEKFPDLDESKYAATGTPATSAAGAALDGIAISFADAAGSGFFHENKWLTKASLICLGLFLAYKAIRFFLRKRKT